MSKGMLGTLPLANISGPVSSLIEALGGENGKEILEELKKFNRKEPCWVTNVEKVNVENIDDLVGPKKFFKNKKSLWIDRFFIMKIVTATKPIKTGKEFNKSSFQKLKQSTTGHKLLEMYPKSVWNPNDFCWSLEVELAKQLKDQEGTAFDKNVIYIFLVRGVNNRVFVVSVFWASIRRKWYIDTWSLGNGWNAGIRFFSKPTD